MFKICLLCTAYAKKMTPFYTIVGSYFVIYTIMITKKTSLYASQLTPLTPFVLGHFTVVC